MNPIEQGFFTTAVLQAAEESLKKGRTVSEGVVAGAPIELAGMLRRELGAGADAYGLA
jgi:hypothetical protein